jgi:hypothetical protein
VSGFSDENLRKCRQDKERLSFSCSSSSSPFSIYRDIFLSKISHASLIAFSPNLSLKVFPLSSSSSLVSLVNIQKSLARTSSVFPAPMFLQEDKTFTIYVSSSESNSDRETLYRHSTTASFRSSFGTSIQLKRAVSLLFSFSARETSSKTEPSLSELFTASSQKKDISCTMAMNRSCTMGSSRC